MRHHQKTTDAHKAGFTLIELSIVLVIIGLLLGAIVIGRDLIRAAAIRSQITQFEQLNTAVVTFRDKYDAIPGDMRANQAAAVGFTARSGAARHGDGNGIAELCNYDPFWHGIGCEVAFFWNDLSSAKLIAGSFTTATDSGDITIGSFAESLLYMPRSKIADNATTILRVNNRTSNWFGILHIDFAGAGASTFSPLTILDVSTLDSKMDDGAPITGKVLNVWGQGAFEMITEIVLFPACGSATAYDLMAATPAGGCPIAVKMTLSP